MRRRDHEVIVLALQDEPRTLLPKFAESGIPCLSLGLNRHYDVIRALIRARRWVGNWRPDILHSHMVHANIFARLLRLIAGVPVVVATAHSINEGGLLRTLAYRVTDRLADITTNVSPDAVAAFVRRGACPASRITYVANGIDVKLFQPNPQARMRMRRELDVEGRYVFLAVGRFYPVKNYPSLINAFYTFHRNRENSCLLIAGDGPLRDRIEAHIASMSLGKSVRLLGLRSDISDLINAADCFVMSSIFEGAPMALIEAMSCGKEIVTTEFGSATSLLGDTGLIVPVGKPDLLAAAMLKTADRQRNINDDARERAVSMFSINAIAKTWESMYWDLLQGRTVRAGISETG
jgi:glycosyltransferase involved in cell wall biosynthesis